MTISSAISKTSNARSKSLQTLKIAKAEAREEQRRRLNTNALSRYRPHLKQLNFHAAGKAFDERLFMAGNQLGKSLAGGMETAMHLTGRYPDWWEGAVFSKPTKIWASGVSGESVRKNAQRILIGEPENESTWGTAAIPKDAIRTWSRATGVPNLLDSVVVRFGGGGDVRDGDSFLTFMSYIKGQKKWQGPTIDGVWFDEEPPIDVYTEGRTRTNLGQIGPFSWMTFTPLLGMSEVVRAFLTPKEIEAWTKRSSPADGQEHHARGNL